MARGDKKVLSKPEPQKPRWATCDKVIGYRYVSNKDVDALCQKKARSDGLCDVHGGTV
jgi:hypothetical protein